MFQPQLNKDIKIVFSSLNFIYFIQIIHYDCVYKILYEIFIIAVKIT